ncbi:MAG: hypothetical protein ACREJQ_00450 [bacterium]
MRIEQQKDCLNDFLRLWQNYWQTSYPYLTFDADSPPRLSQAAEEDFLRMKSDALKAFPKVEEICWGPNGPDLVAAFHKSMEASNSLYDLAMNSHNREQLRKNWGAVHNSINLCLGGLEQEESHARSFPYQIKRFTTFIAGGSPAMWLLRFAVLALAAWKLGELLRPFLPGTGPPSPP